jgi:hypothetical protein
MSVSKIDARRRSSAASRLLPYAGTFERRTARRTGGAGGAWPNPTLQPVRIAHVRERTAPAGAPWRLAAALEQGTSCGSISKSRAGVPTPRTRTWPTTARCAARRDRPNDRTVRATPHEAAAARPSSTTGGSSVGGCDGRAMDPRVRAARHSFEGHSSRCGPCAHVPRNIMTKIRKHTMQRESPATRAASCLAQPSQRDGQLDDDADNQTAYQSAHTVAVNRGRG